MFVPWLVLVALVRTVQSVPEKDYQADLASGVYGQYPVRSFHSSKVQAPEVRFPLSSDECDDGRYYFITPRGWKVPTPGAMILDGNGELIWGDHFENSYGGQAYDLKVQKYQGKDHLTFWLGDDTVRGHGAGHFYMLNSSYDLVAKIGATNSLFADLHDLVITPQGTALLLIFQSAPADLRAAGRKFNDVWNQAVWDCVFQEINIESGELLFEWHASEHVNITRSYNTLESVGEIGTRVDPYDWFHINSIQKDYRGHYLISARNTHAIYYINGETKEIIWTLGGKDNSFQDLSDGHAFNFAWQHDAQFVPRNAFPEIYTPPPAGEGWTTRLLTIFDNAALDWDYSYGPPYSRGLLLELTYPTPGPANSPPSGQEIGEIHGSAPTFPQLSEKDQQKISKMNGTNRRYTARVIREYVNPKQILSSTQGSLQLLPQGDSASAKRDPHVLVGYGINAVVTEFASNGTVLTDMHFAAESSWEKGDVQSYRAFKQYWQGRPRKSPSAVVRGKAVHVSWNGATEVSTWLLQVSEKDTKDEGPRKVSQFDSEKEDDDEEVYPSSPWKDVGRVNKTGFETAIPLEQLQAQLTRSQNFLRVVALDRRGRRVPHGISGTMRRSFVPSFALPDKVKGLTSSTTSRNPVVLLVVVALVGWIVATVYKRLSPAALHRVRRVFGGRRGGRFTSQDDLLPRRRMD